MLQSVSKLMVYMLQVTTQEQRLQKFKGGQMKDQKSMIEYPTWVNMHQVRDGTITQLAQWSVNWVEETRSGKALHPCIALETKNEKFLSLRVVSHSILVKRYVKRLLDLAHMLLLHHLVTCWTVSRYWQCLVLICPPSSEINSYTISHLPINRGEIVILGTAMA